MLREVKFSQTLAELLVARGFSRKRNVVARAVFISPSALSQYLSGRARPGLDTLARLADFLNTSLDYLVFGSERAQTVVDPGPLARYIDATLVDVQKRTSDYAGFVGRVGQALAKEIDDVAHRVAGARSMPRGLVEGWVGRALESYSILTSVATTDLRYNILEVEAMQAGSGMYTDTVASNLSRGRTYRFLLPADEMPWQRLVEEYRYILSNRGVSDEALAKRCLFKVTHAFLPVGFGVYTLDIDALAMNDPLLHERVRHAIVSGDQLGFVIAPSSDLPENALMGERSVGYALRSFQAIWTAKSSRSL